MAFSPSARYAGLFEPWLNGLSVLLLALAKDARRTVHFGCGAGAPPEVPGGGITFESPVLGTGFSMAGSTSFGWMTPFDWSSFLLRSWPGAVGVSGLTAWANAQPAESKAPATNKQSRKLVAIVCSKRVDGRSVP